MNQSTNGCCADCDAASLAATSIVAGGEDHDVLEDTVVLHDKGEHTQKFCDTRPALVTTLL